MYPNPQDVLPLPARPDLEHYRKRAKDLATACRSGDEAISSWASDWIAALLQLPPDAPERTRRDATNRARQVAAYARDRLTAADCSLSQAQFVIARAHGFTSWPKFVHHLEGLSGEDADLSAFERAADAIVAGKLEELDSLLARHPNLVRGRSDREHGATLLHYVSANGVENYRQKTPKNIVAIATRLLDAGADINAEADVYGGGATTLGLVVTSAHPRQAGVQIALADLLIDRGARLEARIVRSCLMNGCPEAAVHMAARGASLDLEEAAGIDRLDLVSRYFEPTRKVSDAEASLALMMGAWYDRRAIVTYLLDHGVAVGSRHPKDDGTALHIAAYLGNSALVEMLLRRGAPVNVVDGVYKTPPIVWALHGWLVEHREPAERYKAVVRMLAEAGAEIKAEWIDDDRVREDKDLYTALSRRVGAR
jgi:ankyrin repeat protein